MLFILASFWGQDWTQRGNDGLKGGQDEPQAGCWFRLQDARSKRPVTKNTRNPAKRGPHSDSQKPCNFANPCGDHVLHGFCLVSQRNLILANPVPFLHLHFHWHCMGNVEPAFSQTRPRKRSEKEVTLSPKKVGISWGLAFSRHPGRRWPVLRLCWHKLGFRGLLGADPQ